MTAAKQDAPPPQPQVAAPPNKLVAGYRWVMGLGRRLYDWVLHWAETPYGAIALAVLALAESSFFPIPPDVLLIALALSVKRKAFRYALICSVASVVGGMLGYAIGSVLWNVPGTTEYTAVAQFFFDFVPGFTVDRFREVQELYRAYDFWVVFAAGFTPIPYKVITITAGVFDLDLVMFTIASAVGRSARFFLVAGLLYVFGETIKRWIDRYFNLVTLAFLVLLAAGFVVLKLVLH